MQTLPRIVTLIVGTLLSLGLAAAERQISVTGHGEVSTPPDSAEVSLAVQSTRYEASAAKTEVDRNVNAFLAAIDKLGFDEEAVKAGAIRTHSRYENRGGERSFAGYQAVRPVTVRIDDLDDLNALLDTALDAKIDDIQQIRYEVSDSNAMQAKARQLAIEDSKQQAAELAEAYGAELGPIVSIEYRTDNAEPMRMERESMAMMRADSGSQGRYLPEEIHFNDRIDVVFDLIVDR